MPLIGYASLVSCPCGPAEMLREPWAFPPSFAQTTLFAHFPLHPGVQPVGAVHANSNVRMSHSGEQQPDCDSIHTHSAALPRWSFHLLASSCGMTGVSPLGPMCSGRGIRSVAGMEHVMNFLSVMAQVSAVLFAVMVVTAMVMASVISYRRGRRRHIDI